MSSTNREHRQLFLLFELEDMIYALSCDKIREIVPPVKLLKASGRSEHFAGFLNYRGQIVPVIDMCLLLKGKPCKIRLSTRIILTEYAGNNGDMNLLGLMTQGVSGIVRKSEKDFSPSSSGADMPLYFGGISMEDSKIIQYIDLGQIVAQELKAKG